MSDTPRTKLFGDVYGGITTAVISLPMALTFGIVSGAGAIAGLYGAIIVGFFAALVGGTRTLISEPTGPMTVTMTAVVTGTMAADPEQGLALAFTVVMLAGLFQVIFGWLKLGRYITLMPYSVISGFMSGIGVLLVLTQIAPLLGHPTPSGGAVGTLRTLPSIIANARVPELVLAAIALAILFLTPRKLRRFAPPPLLAVIVGTLIALAFFSSEEIRTIGRIPMGLPRFVFPRLTGALATDLVVDALVLAVLGSIDSLLTAMIADSLTKDHHDSNRELIGQGVGNMLSGLFGGLPGAGATMGTVVNIRSGASTPRAGIIRSLVLLAIVLALAPLLQAIPMAVLAAIAVKVGVDILDWSFLGRAHRISFTSTIIMYAVLAMTVFVDLIVAVAAGVFVANILTIERLSNLPSTRVTTIDPAGQTVLTETERTLLDGAGGRIVLFHLSGPMIFGVAQAIAREHAAMGDRGEVLVVDLADVSMIGTTVTLALENLIRETLGMGKPVVIASPSEKIREQLRRTGVLDDGALIASDRTEALTFATRNLPGT